jgi:hypothetical protein
MRIPTQFDSTPQTSPQNSGHADQCVSEFEGCKKFKSAKVRQAKCLIVFLRRSRRRFRYLHLLLGIFYSSLVDVIPTLYHFGLIQWLGWAFIIDLSPLLLFFSQSHHTFSVTSIDFTLLTMHTKGNQASFIRIIDNGCHRMS